MLPTYARMRRSVDFRRTVRLGVRAGRRTVVVHAFRESSERDPLVGFVVSKGVGSAVCRNRVRRRLRHLARPHLSELSRGTSVVVRALPPASSSGSALSADLDAAWASAIAKLGRR